MLNLINCKHYFWATVDFAIQFLGFCNVGVQHCVLGAPAVYKSVPAIPFDLCIFLINLMEYIKTKAVILVRMQGSRGGCGAGDSSQI